MERRDLRARLEYEGEKMEMDIWRVEDNTAVRISGEGAKMIALIDKGRNVEDFLKKAAKFYRKAHE